jgi:Amt family ammonium transporter
MRPLPIILFAIAALLLRVGFALQSCGLARPKNSVSAILRAAADTAAAGLAFWVVGAGILFQNVHRWIGFDSRFCCNVVPEFAATEFFHMVICSIGCAIVTGAIAERSRFHAGVISSAVLGGLVFPLFGHWVWYGPFRDWNFLDVGGATVIHLSGAIFGAVAVAVLGSRTGKYNSDGSSNSIAGHSMPMTGIGVFLLLVGWFPYLLGCVSTHWTPIGALDEVVISIAAMDILLAAIGGVAGGLFYSHLRYGKPDLFFIFSGMLGGLVAISSGLANVHSCGGALIIGIVSGVIVPYFGLKIDRSAKLDDPVGLIAVNGIGAIWGTLATAIFAPLSNAVDHFRLLGVQCGGLAVVTVASTAIAVPLFVTLKKLRLLRISESNELNGLDIAEHDINAYPDFQQNTIKSPHPREDSF